MSLIPGPRTHPTVKPLAQTNQRSLRSWQVSLGALQIALLLGGVLGGLACAFYLGFFSGQKIGIEMALSSNLSSAMRLPIGAEDEQPLSAEEGLTDVYAKLNQLDAPAEPILPRAPIQDEQDLLGALPTDGTAKAALGAEKQGKVLAEDQNLVVDPPASTGDLSGGIVVASEEAMLLPTSASAKTDSQNVGATLGVLAQQEAGKREVGKQVSTRSTEGALEQKGNKDTASKAVIVARGDTVKTATVPVKASGSSDMKADPEAAAKLASKSKQDSSLVRTTLPRGWFAQVAAPDNRTEAESLARRLQQSGFPVMIENAKVRGQEYFRVLVGPEQTRQQSERLLTQLKREPGLKADPFIRMVR